MENYQPLQPPVWKKILLHPVLHVTLVFLLVFSGVLYIQKRQKEQMMARVEFLSGGPLVIEKGNAATTQDLEMPEETDEATAESNTAPTAMPPPQPPPASATVAANSAAKTITTTPQITFPKVKITMAEVDTEILKKWIPEIQKSGQFLEFGEINMGALPDFAQKIAQEKIIPLESLNKAFDAANKSHHFFSGLNSADEESDLGLSGLINIIKGDDNKYRAEIEVLRSSHFSEGPDKSPRVINTGEILLSAKTVIIIWGLLPHKLPDDALELPAEGILKIYTSPQFKSSKSEFTLILEFDTPNP